jgi:peptidoglycan/LPS O-acetylase OafA/YrhL
MSQENGTAERPHRAGAFDVRNVIAGLIGFYGVVLVLVAIFGEDQSDKTGGVNANLWAGLAMLVFAASFALWSRLRPIVVDPGADVTGDDDGPPGF